MAKLIDVQYLLHYTPPSLDTSVNQAYTDKQELLYDLAEAISNLLSEDCSLQVEDNFGHYLPIMLTLSLGSKPDNEPIHITL